MWFNCYFLIFQNMASKIVVHAMSESLFCILRYSGTLIIGPLLGRARLLLSWGLAENNEKHKMQNKPDQHVHACHISKPAPAKTCLVASQNTYPLKWNKNSDFWGSCPTNKMHGFRNRASKSAFLCLLFGLPVLPNDMIEAFTPPGPLDNDWSLYNLGWTKIPCLCLHYRLGEIH